MKKLKLSNLKKATPAKWVKVGLALTAVSASITGYGLTASNEYVSYFGLACLVVGTFITNMFSDSEPKNEQQNEKV